MSAIFKGLNSFNFLPILHENVIEIILFFLLYILETNCFKRQLQEIKVRIRGEDDYHSLCHVISKLVHSYWIFKSLR